ncbi:t-SNARE domain-containing protein 1-like [Lissotriton helveticus]
MSQEAAGSSALGRKRKIKCSEQELEFLIEGVSRDHDKLFGKQSRKVPDADKRRIWQRIRAKVNSVGVTQRSIDELKKRWYDLRGPAKERIAEKLGEQYATGGGDPTVAPNTPLEDLVEDTINPAACVGVTQLDTSRPTQQSKGAAEPQSTDSEALQIEENTEDTEGESYPSPRPGSSDTCTSTTPCATHGSGTGHNTTQEADTAHSHCAVAVKRPDEAAVQRGNTG